MWAIPYCSQRQLCWLASARTDRDSLSLKCTFNSLCLGDYAPIDHKIPSYFRDGDNSGTKCKWLLMEKIPAVLLARDGLHLALRFRTLDRGEFHYMEICLTEIK